MVCRKLPVYADYLDRWNRFIPGGKTNFLNNQVPFVILATWMEKYLNCPQKLSFTQSDSISAIWLRSKGWDGKQAFACFIIRDSSFLKEDECFNSFYLGKAETAYHSLHETRIWKISFRQWNGLLKEEFSY